MGPQARVPGGGVPCGCCMQVAQKRCCSVNSCCGPLLRCIIPIPGSTWAIQRDTSPDEHQRIADLRHTGVPQQNIQESVHMHACGVVQNDSRKVCVGQAVHCSDAPMCLLLRGLNVETTVGSAPRDTLNRQANDQYRISERPTRSFAALLLPVTVCALLERQRQFFIQI